MFILLRKFQIKEPIKMNEKSVMKNKNLVLGILILIILGVLFVSGCIQQDGDGEIGLEDEDEIEEVETVNWTFEGLRISGEFVDIEIFELPNGSYAMHIPFDTVAYSPDGLTWTMSEDDAIGGGSSILNLPNGGYRAWWSVCAEGCCDIMTAFSSDGYNWGDETKLTSSSSEDPYGTLPFAVILPDETYRMYYAREGSETHTQANLTSWLELPDEMLEMQFPVYNVYSAHSSDGLVWEPDSGIRIDSTEADEGHASSGDVYIREDGKYEMVYCSGWGDIAWAVSDDGLSWTRMGLTGLKGFDPIINVFPDGTIRVYYDNWIATSVYEQIEEYFGIDTSGLPETIDGRPAGIYSAIRETL